MSRRRDRPWILTGVVALIVLPGAVLWDAHRRATAAFEWHERDLQARIASEKSLPPMRPPRVFGEILPGNGWTMFVRSLKDFNALPGDLVRWIRQAPYYGMFAEPEDADVERLLGQAALAIDELRQSLRHAEIEPKFADDQLSALRLELWGAFHASDVLGIAMDHAHRAGQDRLAGEYLKLLLGMVQVFRRYGLPEFSDVALTWEKNAIGGWEMVLRSHGLSSEELASLSRTLEDLWASRVDVLDASIVQDLISRWAIVRGMPFEESTSRGARQLREEPSWRSLYCERVRDARALTQFSQGRSDLDALRPQSARDRAVSFLRDKGVSVGGPESSYRRFVGAMGFPVIFDVHVTTRWALMRVCTAMAWYEAETGTMPTSLENLVPRYLSGVPECPLTGKPLGMKDGSVWAFGPDVFDDGGLAKPGKAAASGIDIVWTVSRKK